MSQLPLTFACGPYDRMEALNYGLIGVEGINLNFIEIQEPREIFDRMVGAQEFDISEMSLAEYITMVAKDSCPFIALPVFPSKAFRHAFICVNRNAGIKQPQDLAGKRIGTPLYTQTAAVWIRGDLENIYGVDLSDVHWIQGAVEKPGTHGDPPAPPQLSKPIQITPNKSEKSLSQMLADGDVDAVLGSRMPASVRTDPDKVAHLFQDFREEEKRYYREHRIHPIMHTVVIRKDVYASNKWIAQSLYKAFLAAKDWAVEQMYFSGAQKYMLPWLYDDLREIDEVFGGDPWPYGIDENRPTLEALVKYMCQQNFIAEEISVEDLFAPIHGRVE
ncbi:MAG: ABC transporter substrate-binding protein [Pseudomonadota bacterium]|nr:ABC transporter substrate-binding protein [Pseudomonadota bacterium]